jgi:hypothetical protein
MEVYMKKMVIGLKLLTVSISKLCLFNPEQRVFKKQFFSFSHQFFIILNQKTLFFSLFWSILIFLIEL